MKTPLTVLILTLLLRVSVNCQEATGTISGAVSDTTGAAIPAASILVRNIQTNLTRSSQSDERGAFHVPALPPGSYNVQISRDRFRSATVPEIGLQVNQVATVNVALEVGAIADSVTVEGAVSLVEPESSTVGQVVGARAIQELPLNGRQFLQLVTLVPGAISGYTRDVSRQGGRRAGSDLDISVSGGRSEYNNYLLDGVLNTDENFNTYVVSPSVDALEEFKVQTSSYSAQYGRGGGAQINIVTKSGTNQLHGTLFEFLRNDKLDAKNFFDSPYLPIPPYRQNQFGGTLGGPIRAPRLYNGRDRTFFFFNYEGFRIRQAQTATSTVALPAWRAGDFTGAPALFDPQTLRSDPNRAGGFLRDPFPQNRIPQNRLDATAGALLKYLPLPNLPGSVRNYLNNASRSETDDQFTFKVDHKLSSNDTLFARHTVSDEGQYTPGAFPSAANLLNLRAQVAAVGETHILSPRTVNEFRFGFNRLYNALLQRNAYQLDGLGEAGITGLSRDPINFGIPAINIAGLAAWGDTPTGYPSLLRDNVFQYLDNLSMTRSAHNLSLGAEIRRYQFNNVANDFTRGNYIFAAPYFTSNPASPAGTGFGFADYLLGLPSNVAGSVGDTSIYDRRLSLNFYLQDDWKVTRRLTLNLGVRYELNPFPVEKYDRIDTVDVGTNPPTIVRAGTGDPWYLYPSNIKLDPRIPYVRDGRFGRSLLPSNKNDWAPRFGLAYALNQKTAIRTAYGLFYSQDFGNVFFDLARGTPRNIQVALPSDPINPQLGMKDAFAGLDADTTILAPKLVFVDPHSYKTSYIQQWTLNVQRELARDLVFEAGYAGTKGTHLGLQNFLNTAPPGPGAVQGRRPWPMYGAVWLFQHRVGSDYNALQTRLEKRYARGVTFLASYTWGKSLDYVSSSRTTGEINRPIDPNNLALERGRSLFDARHNFVFHALYDLPFHRRGASGKFTDGWQISGIFHEHTGLPFTVSAAGDLANTGVGVSRANVVPGQAVGLPSSERSPDRWFNTAAFALPSPYTFGNASRNTVDAPGRVNLDLSIIKNTALTESSKLQFRAEAFNLSNTPPLGGPGATVGVVTFGRISSADAPRQVQLALRLVF